MHGNMVIGIAPSSTSSYLLNRSTNYKTNVVSCRGGSIGKESRNLYKVLCLESENVGIEEIKKAYRTMALRWHPDVCHPSMREESTTKFLELKRAYETLSDPSSRIKYDAQLRSGSSTERTKQVWEAQLSQLKRRRFGAISCKAAPGSKNLYKLLSLESDKASMEEIKKAYRSMALQYHPDLCPPTRKEEFTRMFVEVNKAYETLSDPILRRSYDRELGLAEAAGRSRRSRVNNGVEIRWEVATDEAYWKAQLSELKRRSEYRMRQQGGGSWGSRMRSAATRDCMINVME
ncbi:hypothetical protein H6P81_011577 [Aristolochia fimbriata]|uniref:J domain-containing protein n=1 Tax=Aristolochia fimbriata TaxID=158543 RepID=A0AAV7ERX6_ARIFI|nr:hypothetical protein H6P81_011577 [Aristolochia fimbriata]